MSEINNAKENCAISVIIPCFNEERRIFSNLERINKYLADNFNSYEIIAVNDGSTDKTLCELERAKKSFAIDVVDNPKNQGKGKAVKDGILASRKEIVMFMDADLAIPIEELKKFMREIENGFDIVIASRFVPGLRIMEPVLWYRQIMEIIFKVIRTVIINSGDVKDTQCGFKVFRREAALAIFPQLTIKRFAFDSEIIFIAGKAGYKIKELPITLQNPPLSHIRIFRDSLNMFFDLIKIRVNSLLGRYKV